jgi:hypothetical protein
MGEPKDQSAEADKKKPEPVQNLIVVPLSEHEKITSVTQHEDGTADVTTSRSPGSGTVRINVPVVNPTRKAQTDTRETKPDPSAGGAPQQ